MCSLVRESRHPSADATKREQTRADASKPHTRGWDLVATHRIARHRWTSRPRFAFGLRFRSQIRRLIHAYVFFVRVAFRSSVFFPPCTVIIITITKMHQPYSRNCIPHIFIVTRKFGMAYVRRLRRRIGETTCSIQFLWCGLVIIVPVVPDVCMCVCVYVRLETLQFRVRTKNLAAH